MSRAVQEVDLRTRAARAKLPRRAKPFWRQAEHGIHLGYFKPATVGRPGSWIGRLYLGDGKYGTMAVGPADDLPDTAGFGEAAMGFAEAIKAAVAWGRGRRKVAADAALVERAPVTVGDAIRSYLAERDAKDADTARDARWRLERHLFGASLASRPLALLTERDFATWRAGLTRGGRGVRRDAATPLSPSSIKRLLADVRAGLGAAARRERLGAGVLDAIRTGCAAPHGADRPRGAQILSPADIRRICDAARAIDEDFGDLVLILSATGARFSQVSRLRVADLQADARRIMVPVSRKGRGVKPLTHIACPLREDVVARLRQLAAGRAGHEPLLLTWRHEQRGAGPGRLRGWERAERVGWDTLKAKVLTLRWRAALRAAGLPATFVPLALRHSGIVHFLSVGLPTRVVASMHDTSVSMIERNYAAYIVDASDAMLRSALLRLDTAGIAAAGIASAEVVPLRRGA